MKKKHTPFQPIINDTQIAKLSELLYQKAKRQKRHKQYASVKTVLALLGMGVVLSTAFIAPKATYMIIRELQKKENEWESWKRFNQAYLRQTLRRLSKQKLVEIKDIAGKQQVIITEGGRKRILEYMLDDLIINKPRRWDGKWRLIIYDIPQKKKRLQEIMRRILKNLGLLAMQESIYITPYPCYKEIEFLRSYYGLGEYLKYLLVEKIEDDSVYKTYFNL